MTFRYPLSELKSEWDTGVKQNNRVCPECWDPDHPQNFLFTVDTDDPMSLRDPRPELSLASSRGLDYTQKVMTAPARTRVGKVTVSTS